MARSRNRNNKVHSNNQSKQQNNQYRKKLFRIAALFGADEFLFQYPKNILNDLVSVRIRPPKIRYDGSFAASAKFLREFEESLIYFLSNNYIAYKKNNMAISLYDYITTLTTLYYFFKNLDQNMISEEKILSGINKLIKYYENPPQLYEKIEKVINNCCSICSNHETGYYWIKYVIDYSKGNSRLRFQLMFTPPGKEQITIQNKERPIFRIGIAQTESGVIWQSIPSIRFNQRFRSDKEQFEVYVQSHAVERLKQRLSPINQQVLLLCLYFSICNAKIRKTRHHNYLLEYHLVRYKLGYFSLEIIDNKAIITTFLFITSDGTPEGNKLKHAAGLAKSDKQFCKIDQLDTFLEGDFSTSDELKVLFTEAGCDHLLALDHKKLKSMCMKDIECGSKNMDFISKFIQKNRDYLDNSEPE